MAEILETLLVLVRADSTQLQRELDRIQRESAETKAKVSRNLDFASIGAGLTGLAGGGGILYSLREMAQESANTTAQMRSFDNTVRRTGTSSEDASRVVREIARDFGLLESQVQAAATPLLKVGIDAQTTGETLRSLAASAGLLGNDIASSMTTGGQGVAMLRSELLETSGITINAPQTWGPYAESVGKATAELSDNEKALAFARGVIREAKPDVEDFADSFGEFARSQADSRAELAEFRNTVGAIAQDALVPFNKAVSSTIGFFNDLPEPAQRTATAFVAAGAGATALAAGAGTLALLLGPLAGPAGLFILVAAGIAAFVTAANAAPGSVKPMETAIDDLKRAHEDLLTAVNNTSEAERTAARQRLENAIVTAQAAARTGRVAIEEEKSNAVAGLKAGGFDPERGFFDETTGTFRPTDQVLEGNAKVQAVRAQYQELRAEVVAAQGDLQAFDTLVQQSLTNVPNGLGGDGNNNPPLGGRGTDEKGDYVVAPQPSAEVTPDKLIATPEVSVNVNGEPIDIFGVVFDPKTGTTSKGAAPNAEVNVEAKETPRVPVDVDASRTYGRGYDYMGEAREQVEAYRELRTELEGFSGTDATFATLSDSILSAGEAGEISKYQLAELLALIEQLSGKTVNIKVKATAEGGIPLTGPDGAVPTAEVDRSAAVGPRDREISENDEWDRIFDRNNDLILDAGETFNQKISDAGLDFAGNVANALADGKITGDEAAGIGGALGSAGGAALGTLLLGPIGTELGGIVGGLLGNLIGGLFGGEDDEEDRRNADASRRTNAAALELNFYFNQVNNFPNNVNDAQTQASLRKQSRALVEDALKAYNPKQFRGEAT